MVSLFGEADDASLSVPIGVSVALLLLLLLLLLLFYLWRRRQHRALANAGEDNQAFNNTIYDSSPGQTDVIMSVDKGVSSL